MGIIYELNEEAIQSLIDTERASFTAVIDCVTSRLRETYQSQGSIDEDPTMLEQHCISRNRSLWSMDRYEDFLEERRNLLAAAAQSLVNSLLSGKIAN